MGLDIRVPIGFLFTALGLILLTFGGLSNKSIYQRSLDINVNLLWGGALLIFGLAMLLFGKRAGKGSRLRADDKSTEAKREHA